MDAEPILKKSSARSMLPTVVLILSAMVAAAYQAAPQTIGEQARRWLLQRLQAHYPGTEITLGKGTFLNGIGIVFDDLKIRVPGSEQTGWRELLRVEHILVETDFNLQQAMEEQKPFTAKRTRIIGAVLNVWPEQEGWSAQRLWPLPEMGPVCPHLEVQRARVRLYAASSDTKSRPLEFDNLKLAVNSIEASSIAPAKKLITLRAGGEYAQTITVDGLLSGQTFAAMGQIRGLRISETLAQRIPQLPPSWLPHLSGLALNSDLQFNVRRDVNKWDYEVQWNCHEGRLAHPLLPSALESLQASVLLKPDKIEIQHASGRFGDAPWTVSGAVHGCQPDSDLHLRIKANDFVVTNKIATLLPEPLQRSFDRIRPQGMVNFDSRVERRANRWTADAVFDLCGVDVCVDKFPYPITQLTGKINYRNRQAWSEQLVGRIASQGISIGFLKSEPDSGQPTWVKAAMDGPIPIDSQLIDCLTARGEDLSKLERFVRLLAPRGNVQLTSGLWQTSSTGEKSNEVDLKISGGSLRYAEFPYPLYDVSGTVSSRNDTVHLKHFVAVNGDNATISCEGKFENLTKRSPRSIEGDWRVGLHFQAREIPLDETLRAALPESSRQTWDGLAPNGVLDFLDVHVSHAQEYRQPLLLIAAKQSPRQSIDRHTVSLRPTLLPYRLDVMEGAVTFDGYQVIVDSIDARHDATRLAADGSCIKLNNGQWQLNLNILSGSRLHPDSELISSLPPQVRGAFQRLQLRGPLSIRGSSAFLLPDDNHPEPVVDWGLSIQLEGNRIGDVGPVHDLRGEIEIKGHRDGAGVIADGTVNIDSMHVHNQQVTSIVGPFALRDDRLLMGETISLLGEPPAEGAKFDVHEPIKGSLFGGTATISGEMLLSNGTFDVMMAMQNGDLATLLADLGESHATVGGKSTVGNLEGRVRLEGTMGAVHLLKGSGSGKLSNANLYQLPILIQLFNLVSVKPSEAIAFTNGEVRFNVYGDEITFNQILLWGDIIALDGSGTLSRSREVDLSFSTRVSPQNGWSELVRPFGEANYTLWTINVKGPVSDPQIERKTLDTLERMFPGIATPQRPVGPIRSRLSEARDRLSR